jgi:hypothetical protein
VTQENFYIDSNFVVSRKRQLSALPKVGPYIYDVKISGFTRSSIYTGCPRRKGQYSGRS